MSQVRDQGSVLLLALLLTLLIVAIGVAVLWLSRADFQRSVPRESPRAALFAVEAGIERARTVLAASDEWSVLLGGPRQGGCGARSLREGDDPAGRGNVLCDPRRPGVRLWRVPVIEQQRGGGKARARLSYTVHVRNDPLEASLERAGPFRDGDRRLVLLIEAIADRGARPTAVEVVVSAPPLPAPFRSYRQQGLNAAGNNAWRR